jgi:ASC-1-like (ASCH) protein
MPTAEPAVVELSVQSPWFEALRDGAKTVEGRLAGGKSDALHAGAHVVVRHPAQPPIRLLCEGVARYASFRQMLEQEGVRHVLPGVEGVAQGVRVYRKFYAAAEERARGVLAIRLGGGTKLWRTPLAAGHGR